MEENTVRYHLQRQASAAVDGRTLQEHKADGCAAAIAHYLEDAGTGPVNLASLHEWRIAEHDFAGSLRGLQRYFRRHFSQPAVRARRRVGTPPGAQAQADWAKWPRVWIAGRPMYALRPRRPGGDHRGRGLVPGGKRRDEIRAGTLGAVAVAFGFGKHTMLGIEGTYLHHDASDAVLLGAGLNRGQADASVLAGSLLARRGLSTSDRWTPFVAGGAGVYNVHARIGNGSQTVADGETVLGGRLGLGLRANLAKAIDLLGQTDYHLIGTCGGSTQVVALSLAAAVRFTRGD